MNDKEPRFSETRRCGHCGNTAPMKIVAEYDDCRLNEDRESGSCWQEGNIYQLLKCPACDGLIFRRYYFHDMYGDDGYLDEETLYPNERSGPVGLPDQIERAYAAAKKVRSVDANAFGVLLRRVLELVCLDREASGRTLAAQLQVLAENGEIPAKLVDLTKNLRQLGNVGAHASLGALTEAEVPILDDLCRAVLEYVYSAPFLAQKAEDRLRRVQSPHETEHDS